MADYRTVTACRLCDSTQLVQALDLGETPLANELDGTELFPLVVNRCADCGHHQLSIAVNAERLWGPSYPYQSGTSPVFRAHLERLADEVAALKPGGRVLEIGSNDGTLLDMMLARKLSILGVDPSCQSGWTATGSPQFEGPWPLGKNAKSLLEALMGAPTFDVILALNVFAHVDDLHGFTAAVKEALAPDGVFIVEVGDQQAVTRRGHFDTVYHEHMSYHDAWSLEPFFRRHGLRIVETHRNSSQGGTLRLFLGHADASSETGPNHAASMASLRPVIDSRAAALRKALNKLFQRDEMVCIYGAPAKLTTLLYATGLQSMPFNCVGEDNPRKVGRTTPGNHIPIVSVEDMLAREPDAILVAAWNFFDDIRDKLRRLGFAGDIINPMGAL